LADASSLRREVNYWETAAYHWAGIAENALAVLKACVDAMSDDHPGSDEYWRAVEAAEAILSASAGNEIIAPAECDQNCDDPHCHYSHTPLTLRQAYENCRERLRDVESERDELRRLVAPARTIRPEEALRRVSASGEGEVG
jgi:hypothetical protein